MRRDSFMDNINSVIDFVNINPTVWKYVKYQIHHNHYMSEFKEMQEKIKNQQVIIDTNFKTQLSQPGKIPHKEVEAWLEKASQETIEEVVEDLIYRGGCFTYICSSRKLDKKTHELNEIFMQGEQYTIDGVSLVADDPSIKGVPLRVEECSVSGGIQEQILKWLKEDNVTRIAVWGVGGVGKTTIMKQVHSQLLKEPKFNKVIWVKVSKEFDILKFQKTIAISLELNLDLKDDENETKAAELISQKLRQGNYVLILDDVWQQFCVEDVGIPNLVGNNGCKLVLTTRSQDVARAMDCMVIPVNPLPPDEALALFLMKAGSDVLLDGRIKRDIEPFLKQILQKCQGVPLAIVTVAKSMRGKLHPRSWKWALSKLSKFEGIVDCLKFSYEYLESEKCQVCFLYCALYPRDYEIPKEELIEYWIEEGFIYNEGETRDAMNCEGHDILDKLVDNCLLELVKGKDKEDSVSMHDLLREMALDIKPQFLVKAGMGLEKLPEEHEWREDLLKVSLMKNYITEIPSSTPSPRCPILTTLLLSNNNISTIPEAFFEDMLGLKILDLSYNPKLSRLPNSISKLEKLTTLLLRGCESLREVPSLSNFGDLKKLDLWGTSIEELPQGLNMLTNMKYLCLGGELSTDGFGRRLSKIPDGLLQTLSKLQHLEVHYSIPLKGGEVGRLGKLEYLKGRFSTLHEIGIFFNSGEKFLNMYNVFVRSYNEEYSEIDVKLKFIVCCDINICGEPNWLPFDVQRLKISSCKDVRRLNDILGFQDATDLRFIDIKGCDDMEFVLSLSWLSRCNLEELALCRLDNLNAMFGEVGAIAMSAPLPAGTISSLKYINVSYCNKIKKLFQVKWLWYLPNLETIEVYDCEQLEEIIWSEHEGGEKVTLPKLESLVLMHLHQLKSIYSGSSFLLLCNSIKKIKILTCPKIESVFWSGFNPLPTLEDLDLQHLKNLKSVLNEEALGLSPALPPRTTFSLKGIHVSGCDQLKKVFSSGRLLGYFQFLETIHIQWCSQMEELISSSAHEEEKITLPKLQSLELMNLPQLKSIYSGSSTILICDSIKKIQILVCPNLERVFWSEFNPLPILEDLDLGQLENLKSVFDEEAIGLLPPLPPTPTIFFSLKKIRISDCDQLKKVFSSRWLFSYFQFLETIRVGRCFQMEELISSSASEEEENITLPNLQRLELTELPSLKSICSSSSVLICDSIESLKIVDCEKLKRIPLNFKLLDNAQSSHPSSLKEIVVDTKECWESLEWDHPNAKDILLPFCKFPPR